MDWPAARAIMPSTFLRYDLLSVSVDVRVIDKHCKDKPDQGVSGGTTALHPSQHC